MKKLFGLKAIFAIVSVSWGLSGFTVSAIDYTNLLSGTLGNVVQGVLSKSKLSVNDIAGEWTSNGSAVSFQDENLLKKAGGYAIAGAVESQIDPYYKKLGLNNAVLTVETDGSFTLKANKLILKGTAVSNGDGTFNFNFKAFGKLSLGSVKTYVQKSGNNIDVMFDASKLKSILSGIAKVTGISMAKTVSGVLDSYSGMCVGFKMSKTGSVAGSESSSSASSVIQDAVGKIFNGGSSSSSSSSTEAAPTQKQETKSSEPSTSTKSSSSSEEISSKLFELVKSKKK